jgi:ABC-type glutathione transport system ATPase component
LLEQQQIGEPITMLSGSAPQDGRPIIEMAGVAKTYRTRDGEVPSLRPIDLAIYQGEFFVVVGPSGCGKTTLLKMVAGLLPPSAGQVRVDGRPVTKPHGGVGIVEAVGAEFAPQDADVDRCTARLHRAGGWFGHSRDVQRSSAQQ